VPTGYRTPVTADPTHKLGFPLYDMVFRPATPWPYTPGGTFPQHQDPQGKPCPAPGNDAGGYAAALSYIAGKIGLSDYSSDLRGAYVALDQSTWSDEKVDLLSVQYAPGNGFTEAELCNLKGELQQEFDWLDNVKTKGALTPEPAARSRTLARRPLRSPSQRRPLSWETTEKVAALGDRVRPARSIAFPGIGGF